MFRDYTHLLHPYILALQKHYLCYTVDDNTKSVLLLNLPIILNFIWPSNPLMRRQTTNFNEHFIVPRCIHNTHNILSTYSFNELLLIYIRIYNNYIYILYTHPSYPHLLNELLEDGVVAPVLLEDLAEVGEGDGCAVAPEVWLQSLFQHRNSLVHQVE